MPKLQKSLKQQQRHSLQAQKIVSKLTPDEIRLLNDNAGLIDRGQKQPWVASIHTPYSALATTPPLTPDRVDEPSQNTGSGLPTPPQSPHMADGHSRDLGLGYEPAFAHTHLHGTDTDSRTTSQPTTSRTSSMDSTKDSLSSRDGEQGDIEKATRHEQSPRVPPPIPFAQFSRLGRSHAVPLDKRQTETGNDQLIHAQHSSVEGPGLPLPVTMSPRAEENQGSEAVEPPQIAAAASARAAIDAAKTKQFLGPRDLLLLQSEEQAQPTTVPSSVTSVSQGRSKMPNSSYQLRPEQEHPKLKNARRATMLATKPLDFVTVPYSQTASGTRPKMKDSLKEDLPSAKICAVEKRSPLARQVPDMSIHPALRPQGPQPPVGESLRLTINDRKKLVDPQTPVYNRCNHCGKLKKVPAFQNELEPVPESAGTVASNMIEPGSDEFSSGGNLNSTVIGPIDLDSGSTALECHDSHHKEGTNQLDDRTTYVSPVVVQPLLTQVTPQGNMPMSLQTPAQRLRTRRVVRFPSLHFNAGNYTDAEDVEDDKGDWNVLLNSASTKPTLVATPRDTEGNVTTSSATTQNDRHPSDHKRATSLPVHNVHPFNSAPGRQEGRGRALQRPTPVVSQKPDKHPSTHRVRFDDGLTKYRDSEFAVLLPGGHRRTESQPLSYGHSPTHTATTVESKSRMQHYVISGINGAKPGVGTRRSSLAFVQLLPDEDNSLDQIRSQNTEHKPFEAQERGSLTVSPAITAPKKKRNSSVARNPFAMVAAVKDYVRPRTDPSPRPTTRDSDQPDYSLNISRSNPRSRESTSRVREQSVGGNFNRQRSYASAEMINGSMTDIFVPPNPPFLADARLKT